MTIVNDDSRVVNKLEASLTDDARVVIYNRRMLIVQARRWNRQKCLSFESADRLLYKFVEKNIT